MKSYVDAKISEIRDPSFQKMVDDLYCCLNLDENDFKDNPFSYLLNSIVNEGKVNRLTIANLPEGSILEEKFGKLLPDSVVSSVCEELISRRGLDAESYRNKTVCVLIRDYLRKSGLRPPCAKRSTKLLRLHENETRIINRRRVNRPFGKSELGGI